MSYQLIDIMQRKDREIERERERYIVKKDRNLCLYPNTIFLLLIVALFHLDLNRIKFSILA